MIIKRVWFILIGITLLTYGCATWKPVKAGKTQWKSGDFRAELPVRWAKGSSPGHVLFMTADGQWLQQIGVWKTKTNKELPITKKTIQEDMLLQEIAEVVLNEIRLNESVKNFKLISNKPTKLGDMTDALRLEYTFNNDEFVRYHDITYGFLHDKKYYEIEFSATVQHNFDAYVKDFEEFVDSFKVEDKMK